MKKCLVMLAAILLCLFISGVPFAFGEDEDTEGDEFTLEEITVTAQKRKENQQKVAIAMEVMTGEDLVTMGKNDIADILKDVAAIEIKAAATGTRINIRGLVDDAGVMNDQNLQASMVSLNVDGAYNNMANAGDSLFDVERVEVLMGPQSTMYGANAPGGIVNIVTASPKTDKFSANATAGYGSFDLFNLQGALNVPVIQDTFALRLSANHNQQGSWVEGDPKSESTAVRLKALWNVYEDLDMTVTGSWTKKSSGGMMGGQVKEFINQDDVDDPWTPYYEDETRGPLANRDDQITKGLSAEINWSLPFADLSVIPSYSKSDASGPQTTTSTDNDGNTTVTNWYRTRDNEQKGIEVRITNPESFELFDWILGATKNESTQQSLSDYDGIDSDRSMEIIQNKSAYFGNITYPLPFYDRLRLTAGYRKSWDESYGIGVQGDPSTTGRTWEEGNNEKRSKPNWKFGFEYDAADNMMVYGNYASSYRSLNAVGRPVQGEWPPNENLKSYTMGLKSRWLDNRLQVNLNAYYYDYQNKYCVGFIETYATEEDLGPYDFLRPTEPSSGGPPPPPPGQASAQQPPGGPTGDYEEVPDGVYPSLDIYDSDGDGIYDEPLPIRVTDPSANGFGNFSSLGIDLSTTWIITSKDRLNLSIAYLDSQWEDLHFRYFYAPENTETDFPDVPDFRYNLWHWEDFSGVTPENAPKWGVTANYQHNFTLGALGNLTPRIDMKYKSEYSLSGQWNENKAPYIYAFQEAYTMWDASAAFQHSSGKWSLNAYVKNLTNYAVKTQARVYGNYARMRLGDPRTYGMTFSIKFF